MLGRLLFVRLKAAEKAFQAGRLDEAYRLAVAPDLRAHRRGAAVLKALTEKFVERARVHFRAERCAEALLDLDRAAQGGGKGEEIAELRAQVHAVAGELQRQQLSRDERLHKAKKRVEDGSLAAGRKMLDRASGSDHAARELRRNIEERAGDAAESIESAKKLLAQGQLASAADRVRRAKSIDASNENIVRVEASLCSAVLDRSREAIIKGRLGRAEDELECLGDIGDNLPAKRELADALSVAREAARHVRANDYPEARRAMMNLERLFPKAAWIGKTIRQLGQVGDLHAEIGAGPLADLTGSPSQAPSAEPAALSLDDTVALPGRGRDTDSLPNRLLLLVDGGGSFLLLRGDQVSVGRAASTQPADISIFSDLAERHANFARVDEDYFLFSTKDVDVAGRRTKHQLLRDGLRIALGRKAKFTFRIPSRKSLTAVLDLSDTTKMPNDVRRVVLFHRHATIGQGGHAHMPCRNVSAQLVLFERSGSLWIRSLGNGLADSKAVKMTLGDPMEVAGVGMVLEPWPITPGPAKV